MLSQNSFVMKVSILHEVPLRLLRCFQVIDAPQAMMELHFSEQLIFNTFTKKSSIKLSENKKKMAIKHLKERHF